MANKRITDVDFLDSLNSNESFFVNQNNTIKQVSKGNIIFDIINGGTGAKDAATALSNLGAASANDLETISESLSGEIDALSENLESLTKKVDKNDGDIESLSQEVKKNEADTSEKITALFEQDDILAERVNKLPIATIVKVWENTDSASDFASQDIAVDWAGEYDLFKVEFRCATNLLRKIFVDCAPNFETWVFNIQDITASSVDNLYTTRHVLVSSANNTLTFGNAFVKKGNTSSTNNSYLIPVAVYGIKGIQ